MDACLKVMGDAENQISVITAEMNAAIAEAKKAAEEKAAQCSVTLFLAISFSSCGFLFCSMLFHKIRYL